MKYLIRFGNNGGLCLLNRRIVWGNANKKERCCPQDCMVLPPKNFRPAHQYPGSGTDDQGGVKIIQYREKRVDKSYRAILEECRLIRELTRAAGVTFIVNDYVDVALLVDADGVHVGQDDLPVLREKVARQ